MSLINKYIWIINTLHQAGERGLSLKELNEKWVEIDISYGEPISRQTFDRWKGGILDMMGIVIECHLKGGYRYYIYNPEILKSGELNGWLLDTYTTANALSQNIALKDRILVEEIPSSRSFLTNILGAMRENRVIEITYRGFGKGKDYTFPVAPYCVKMFQKRWYLLGLSVKEERIRIYGLDRIEKVVVGLERFEIPGEFDAKQYFSTFFGVVLDAEVSVQRIVIRANAYHQHYLRSLPLHASQREIFTCDDYADFEFTLRPTYDFCMELLKVGNMIEVMEPLSMRKVMYDWVKDMWDIYKND